MNTNQIQAFINKAKDAPIQGYEGDEAKAKSAWLRAGRCILKDLAKELHLEDGTYEIRINPAGPAVSGDVHLHGEWIYVDLSQTFLGPDMGFMWRYCDGKRDYSGRANQWAKWEELLDLLRFACKIRRFMPMDIQEKIAKENT